MTKLLPSVRPPPREHLAAVLGPDAAEEAVPPLLDEARALLVRVARAAADLGGDAAERRVGGDAGAGDDVDDCAFGGGGRRGER